MLKYAFSGRCLPSGADEPSGEVEIPRDFFGLCVASNEDPAFDDFVIGRLKELGLSQVRLDFAASGRTTYQERFLRRLIDGKFRVCLHLVQSCSEAGQMHRAGAARDAWRDFLAEMFSTYGREVELFEIGSTCNRRKWSGYTLASYLAAWQIAVEMASAQNCRLAAPNVTDFEPVYNFAILKEMKRRGILPAVQTDNLFVERAVEPEAYDHKIMGRWLANTLRFNLVRKARMLADIALACGVRETTCAHVSWSLRRIERFLEAAEEKQADYLARYCCLAAASGALKRVYWGPLIGQREGLVDDGTLEFPDIPHVTFYGRARGNIRDYRVRPAYFALQAMSRFVAGTKYIRKIPSERGLEIHEFRGKDGLLHVAWTMNGRRALTDACYNASALKQARFYSHLGAPLETFPAMISESPLYIMWSGRESSSKDNPPILAGQDKLHVLKNIHFAAGADMQYDFVTRGNLAGVCRRDDAAALLDMLPALKTGGDAAAHVLRAARNRVWRCAMPGGAGQLVLKLFRPPGWFKRFLQVKKGDKALRSWNGANELLRRGIATPLPVAFFHHLENPLAGESWYVCAEFAGSFSVRDAFNAFSGGADEFRGIKAVAFYNQFALFLRKMHDRGVYFRDLSAGNLLCRFQKDNDLELTLIDTARALFYEKSIGLRQRLCDLMRICHPLCWRGRKKFIARYMGLIGRRYRVWMNIPFHYYDLKHLLKGKLRGRKRPAPGGKQNPD